MTYDGENRREQWYTNKDLFKMVMDLKSELQETRLAVQKYNGLRADLTACMTKIISIEQQSLGRYSVGKAIRDWGGWIVAVASLVYLFS